MSSTYTEVLETRDNYRVVIISDDDAHEPEADCEPPLLRIERGTVEHRRDNGGDTADLLKAAVERWSNRPGDDGWKFVAKYARAYLGITRLQEWFSDGVYYVAYDSPEWRERAGLAADDDISDQDLFGDWKAYVEGDVWGYRVEKLVHWGTEKDGYDERDTWEPIPGEITSWGYYGREYVEREARADLKGYFKD